MESVIREIGGVSMMINPHSPNEIYFEEGFLESKGVNNTTFSPNEICQLVAGNQYIPMIVTWELLDKCSFGCPFCYIVGHSRHKVVRFQDIKPELQKLIDRGLLYCMMTGGEATLHTDFKEIYRFLKENGVIVELYTNGSLISDDMIDLFREYPPYRIEISIYGVTQKNFETAVDTNKFKYDRILQNTLKLQENGFSIRCKTPLNKLTLKEFDYIRDWCKEKNILHYYSTNIYEAYDGADMNSYEVDLDISMTYEAKKILEIEEMYPGDIDVTSSPKGKTCYTCGIRNYGLHINSGFQLMPCSETHFEESKSNILDVGIDSAISKYRKFVNPFIGKGIVGCTGCEASNHCKMCSAKAEPVRDENERITEFKVPDNHCEDQRNKYRIVLDKMINEIEN